MREILFRGKRTNNGEWVEGGIISLDPDSGYVFITEPFLSASTLPVYEIIRYHTHLVILETVGQFTGLYDKNGTKIFEGDIVSQNWYDYAEPSDDSFGEVVFCEYDCSFSVMDVEKDGIVPLGICHAYHWEAEVIGNVWDHPELLKEEKE